MGTCIGHRNVRYFVSFLSFTALHAFITFIVGLIYFLVITVHKFDGFFPKKDKEKPQEEIIEDEDKLSNFM